MRPIIFFGTGRTGSTLISSIIFRHPFLAFPSNYHHKFPGTPQVNYIRRIFDFFQWNENTESNKLIFPCSGFLRRFEFVPSEAWPMWDRLVIREIPFSRNFLIGDKADYETAIRIRSFFEQMVCMQGKDRLGLKITGPSKLVFLKSIFPDAIFIHITRAVVPTISSFLKVPFWQKQGLHQLWWHGAYSSDEMELIKERMGDPVWFTAFQLKKIIDCTNDEKQLLGQVTCSVSYEAFLQNPVNEIRKILDYADLPAFHKCFSGLDSVNHTQFPDTHYFSSSDLATINEIFNQ